MNSIYLGGNEVQPPVAAMLVDLDAGWLAIFIFIS